MKLLKWLIFGLISVIVVVGVIAFFLPKTVNVSRSQNISAPASAVFTYLNNFKKFNEWSPWVPRDLNTKYQYSGPDEGVGAKMSWESNHPEVGSGSQEIVESRAGEFLKVSLDFGGQGMGFAHFTLSPAGDETNVVWAFETDLGYNPIARYMGLMFDDWIGPDYESGLARLKTVVENAVSNSN